MKKFSAAFCGLVESFQHKSIVIQWILAGCTLIAGLILKLNYYEWITVIMCIGMVLVCEILNTCIEKLCDLYSVKMDERIRFIKDLAAAAVLVSAFAALIIAMLILAAHVG